MDRPVQDTDADVAARGRALSSPLRLRILRLCLHKSRTNKEIADLLDLNPASSLHHVRTLVRTGFLMPEERRKGKRGAVEVPYIASRKSWHTPVDNVAPVLIETFLQETRDLPSEDIEVWRLGVKFNAARREEMLGKLRAIVEEYVRLPADDDGEATSLMIAHHRDPTAG
ncbi:helix-turn-helix domain-containing protein [Arthrobacter sp. ISL-72]|uniref:helix-turn-helix domain-containing protein n=1 Tax=Arthrobacter sp. ISL-72 TaxID=2819114 RepID=UPI001BE6A01E|nr:helix-turn-helix domain-containing protein [Arthrobacter sp. ISL-72]